MKKQEIASILNEPIDLGFIEVPLQGFWNEILRKLGIKRTRTEQLFVTGATASTMYRITDMLEDIIIESEHADSDLRIYHLIKSNLKQICDIIALGIHNKEGNPPKWLSHAIFTQIPLSRIREIMQDVYGRLGVEDFFDIMGLIRNMKNPENDIQETLPATQQSEE